MASRFGSHLKVWFLLVPVLSIAVMPAIPERSLFEVPESRNEIASVGRERADEAVRRANKTFQHAFVDNGLLFRAMVMKLWIVGTLLFALGMFVDGTARHKIKASAAGFVSPFVFPSRGARSATRDRNAVRCARCAVAGADRLLGVVTALLGAFLWKAAESFQSSR